MEVKIFALFGNKIVIHALINSLFIYNCQIKMPPINLLPLVNSGNTARGGMRYKDLQNFILSINFKFDLN